MKIVLKEPLAVMDYSAPVFRQHRLKPGTYRVEQIPNPKGMGVDWWRLQGTTLGTSIPVWQRHLRKGEIGHEKSGKFFASQ